MKRILFFIPFVIAIIFYAVIAATKMPIDILPVTGALICFLVSGLLLSYGKAWGGVFAIIVSGVIIYNGFNNWKMGQSEIAVGVAVLIFYLVCSVYVYMKSRKTNA